MVIFGQKLLYSGKTGCNMAKDVVFGQMWLYSTKVDALGQGGCIRGKVVLFGKSGCTGARWLYAGNVVVFD